MDAFLNYSKMDLVQFGRNAGIAMGDYARASKEELIARLVSGGVTTPPNPVAQLLSAAAPVAAPAAHSAAPVRPSFDGIKVIDRRPVVDVFKLTGKAAKLLAGKMIDIWNDPAAPKAMDTYRWNGRAESLLSSINAMARGSNVWLGGPAGTGKTEFVKQLCARTGRAFIRVQFNAGIEAYDIIGGERVKGGSTYWQDGAVLQGYRHPGAVILLDEIGFARSEYTSDLHAALEPDGAISVAATGEVINKAEGVMFFAADNSNGRGDSTGTYVGVTEKNEAFLSRFSKNLVFSYLPVSEEGKIIADVANCPVTLGALIAQFIDVCRKRANVSDIESPPSMREAFALAEALTDGEPPRYAFETTVVNRASFDSQEILQQIWAANMSDDIIARALKGEKVAVVGGSVVPDELEV